MLIDQDRIPEKNESKMCVFSASEFLIQRFCYPLLSSYLLPLHHGGNPHYEIDRIWTECCNRRATSSEGMDEFSFSVHEDLESG